MLILALTIALVVGVLTLGCILGWTARLLLGPKGTATLDEAARPPRTHDEYLRLRDIRATAYTASTREYDRLVTWISGGALGLSITFVEKLTPQIRPGSAWMLISGWAFLGLALLTSLFSHYSSSRIHSTRLRELDHVQIPIDERSASWRDTARWLGHWAAIWGWTTKGLTIASGWFLVGGFMFLAGFAFTSVSP